MCYFFFTPVLELSKACFKISSIHCMKGAFARVSGYDFFCCLQSLVIYHISSEPFHLGFLIKHLFEIHLFLEPLMLMIVYCDFWCFKKYLKSLLEQNWNPLLSHLQHISLKEIWGLHLSCHLLSTICHAVQMTNTNSRLSHLKFKI